MSFWVNIKRNRSNSDVGVYNRLSNKKNSSSNSLSTMCGSSSVDIPELFARQMLTLSCPAVSISLTAPSTSSSSSQPSLIENEELSSNNDIPVALQSSIVKNYRHATSESALPPKSSTAGSFGGKGGGSVGSSSKSQSLSCSLQLATTINSSSSSHNIATTSNGAADKSSSSTYLCASSSGGSTTGGNGINYEPSISAPCTPANCPNHYHPPANISSSAHLSNSSTAIILNKSPKKPEKQSAKMTGQIRTPELSSPKNQKQKKDKTKQVAIPSKSRQKKFHRHFSQVDEHEVVLNYYSCALIADILLQGHLYITKNYFAFYSNVFGYVTKLLIPTASVLKISKEKTGRIFPNAVGITTEDDKHVFGSLMSRETTYNFLLHVWNSAISPSQPEAVLIPTNIVQDLNHEIEISEASIEEDESSSHTDNEVTLTDTIERTKKKEHKAQKLKISIPQRDDIIIPSSRTEIPLETKPNSLLNDELVSVSKPLAIRTNSRDKLDTQINHSSYKFYELPQKYHTTIASILLLISFATTIVLVYKIATCHYQPEQFNYQMDLNNLKKEYNPNIYEDILKWQALLQKRSLHEISMFVAGNLEQIRKIQHSMSELSSLMSAINTAQATNSNNDLNSNDATKSNVNS